MAIIDTATLAKWTQNEHEDVAADPFAVDLLEKVSLLVCELGGNPGWHTENPKAPIEVWMLTLGVVKRSYENPTRVIAETTGPLSERFADEQALFIDLTDEERAVLARYNPSAASSSGPSLFTISTDNSGPAGTDGVIYATDNRQVNLGNQLSWDVPFLAESDVPV